MIFYHAKKKKLQRVGNYCYLKRLYCDKWYNKNPLELSSIGGGKRIAMTLTRPEKWYIANEYLIAHKKATISVGIRQYAIAIKKLGSIIGYTNWGINEKEL